MPPHLDNALSADVLSEVQAAMRISFCITCMNRLHHLRRALPASVSNLAGCSDQVEFVLLDYRSTDGLHTWVRAHGRTLIERGTLSYSRMLEPEVTHMSLPHAKNVAHNLAEGDVLCNLDADNIVTTAYLAELKSAFGSGLPVFAHTAFDWSTAGRLAFRRGDFRRLGGYDEQLSYCEDLDICRRAEQLGLRAFHVRKELVDYIPHSDRERVAHFRFAGRESPTDLLESLIEANKARTARNVSEGRLVANPGTGWGRAVVLKNFDTQMTVGVR